MRGTPARIGETLPSAPGVRPLRSTVELDADEVLSALATLAEHEATRVGQQRDSGRRAPARERAELDRCQLAAHLADRDARALGAHARIGCDAGEHVAERGR